MLLARKTACIGDIRDGKYAISEEITDENQSAVCDLLVICPHSFPLKRMLTAGAVLKLHDLAVRSSFSPEKHDPVT